MTGAGRAGRAGRPYVAVIGGREVADELLAVAKEVGRLLAEAGAVVVTGGLGGVMAAACRGAAGAGGMSVGVLPGGDRRSANPDVTVALATGLGEARNAVVVSAADAVIAVGGGYGTLSEIGFALRAGKPVVGVGTWELSIGGARPRQTVDVLRASSAVQAVRLALDAVDAPDYSEF